MRKNLIALLLSLSSCVSFNKCPDKEEELKAGLYMYDVLKTAYSDHPKDIILARALYERTDKEYFSCEEDKNHLKKHKHEALYQAFEFLNLSKSEREIILMRRNIVEEDEIYNMKECTGR